MRNTDSLLWSLAGVVIVATGWGLVSFLLKMGDTPGSNSEGIPTEQFMHVAGPIIGIMLITAVTGVFISFALTERSREHSLTGGSRSAVADAVEEQRRKAEQERLESLRADADNAYGSVQEKIALSLESLDVQLTKPDLWAKDWGPGEAFFKHWVETQKMHQQAASWPQKTSLVERYAKAVEKAVELWHIAYTEAGTTTLTVEQRGKLATARHAKAKATNSASSPQEAELAWKTIAKIMHDVLDVRLRTEAKAAIGTVVAQLEQGQTPRLELTQ